MLVAEQFMENSIDRIRAHKTRRKGHVRTEMKGLGRTDSASIFSVPVRGEAAEDDKSK